jgi:hypothetical protein
MWLTANLILLLHMCSKNSISALVQVRFRIQSDGLCGYPALPKRPMKDLCGVRAELSLASTPGLQD